MHNRRQLIGQMAMGAAGVAIHPLLQPMMSQVMAQASGDQKNIPHRFVFLVAGNGTFPDMLQPVGLEKMVNKMGADGKNGGIAPNRMIERKSENPDPQSFTLGGKYELNRSMKTLEPFRDRISILQGLDGHPFGGGHGGNHTFLGGPKADVAAVPTVDTLIGQAQPSVFPVLSLAFDSMSNGVSYHPRTKSLKGKPVPAYCSPLRAYKALFGSAAKGVAKMQYDTESEILDFMAEDIKKAQARIAGSERDKLESYLDAFRDLKTSREQVGEYGEAIAKHAPVAGDKYTSQGVCDVLSSQFEIAATALITGLTKVVTLNLDNLPGNMAQLVAPDKKELKLHTIGHSGSYATREKIVSFHMEQLAGLATRLNKIPEGNGTMLDHTTIVYANDAGETHHSPGANHPVVILGDGGGVLKRAHYVSGGIGKKRGKANVGQVWISLLHAAGKKVDSLNRFKRGPLEELMA